jgi:hypothetical protein
MPGPVLQVFGWNLSVLYKRFARTAEALGFRLVGNGLDLAEVMPAAGLPAHPCIIVNCDMVVFA